MNRRRRAAAPALAAAKVVALPPTEDENNSRQSLTSLLECLSAQLQRQAPPLAPHQARPVNVFAVEWGLGFGVSWTSTAASSSQWS